MPASDTETCLLFLRFSRKLPGTRRGIIFRENWVPSVSKHYSFNNFYRRVEMCEGPYPEPSPVVAGRFNSQHPRKIIRGSGREEGVGSAHGPVTAIRPGALSLCGCSSNNSGSPHTDQGAPAAKDLWEHGFPSSDQPNHPSPALSCWESSPSPEHLLGGPGPRSPFPAC